MTKTTRDILLLGLNALIAGDDLDRAQLAFRNCTEKAMDEPYGQSGRTRRQVLQAAIDYRDQVLAARIDLMKEPVE